MKSSHTHLSPASHCNPRDLKPQGKVCATSDRSLCIMSCISKRQPSYYFHCGIWYSVFAWTVESAPGKIMHCLSAQITEKKNRKKYMIKNA